MLTSTAPPVVPTSLVTLTQVRLSGNRIMFDLAWKDIPFPVVNGSHPAPYVYGCGRRSGQAVRYLCVTFQLSAIGIAPGPVLKAGRLDGFYLEFADWAIEALRQRGINNADGIVVFISGRILNMSGQNPELFISDAELAAAGFGARGEVDLSFNISPLSLR